MRYCNVKSDDANHDASWVDDRIEAYLDGDLPDEERARFERLLQQQDDWQRELALAVNLRDELRAFDTPALSPDVTRAILQETRREAWRAILDRIRSNLWGPTIVPWKPALATLAVLLVAVVMIWVGRPGPVDPASFSDTEVEQALAEVKWTLGYVSKTGKMTGDSVEDILAPLLKNLPNEE
jgi:anti-sigma factor RsiW